MELDIPPKRRVLAFVNPISGSRNGVAIFEEALPIFERAHMEVEMILMERRNQARDHVAETHLIGNYFAVVICGRDGTIHEVVNAMHQKPPEERIPIGVLPGGSSNVMVLSLLDFAGLQYSVHNAILAVCKGKESHFDLMRIDREGEEPIYALIIVMLGLAADVVLESERCRCLGRKRYMLYALLKICENRRYRIKLSFIGNNALFVVQRLGR